MNCDQAKPLITPYADGELDASKIMDLEAHLRDCTACAISWRNLQQLKKAIGQDALYYTAPADLRRSIMSQIRPQTAEKSSRPFWQWQWNWLNTATTGFAVACLAMLLVVTHEGPSSRQGLAQEVASSHFRSLQANHLYDVESTDQHTVKPWFTGKVDFAPPVKKFDQFPLVGGRLDYLNGHSVAALVYKRSNPANPSFAHVINLFISPTTEGESAPAAVPPVRGYNLIHWVHGGMDFWAASDLNQQELLMFAQTYESAN